MKFLIIRNFLAWQKWSFSKHGHILFVPTPIFSDQDQELQWPVQWWQKCSVACWQRGLSAGGCRLAKERRTDPLRLHLSSRQRASLFSHFQGSARSICGCRSVSAPGGCLLIPIVCSELHWWVSEHSREERREAALSTRLGPFSASSSWVLSRTKSIRRRRRVIPLAAA